MKIKRVVYCCNMSSYATQVLTFLEELGIEIAGIFVMADDYYQKNKLFFDKMMHKGLACNLREYLNGKPYKVSIVENINASEATHILDQAKPDLIINNGMMFIYKNDILQRYKVLNTHSGYLPFYRGRCGASWAIYNGARSYGLSCHLVDENVDTGPIVTQQVIEIEPKDYICDLLLKEHNCFPGLIKEAIVKLNDPLFKPMLQNKYEGSYFPVLHADRDGIIDWRTETSEQIYNKIKAFSFPYAGAFTLKDNIKYVITKARYHEPNQFVCSEPGLVFGETEDGATKITTIDGQIVIEKVLMDGEEKNAVQVWKTGSWVYTNTWKEQLISMSESRCK